MHISTVISVLNAWLSQKAQSFLDQLHNKIETNKVKKKPHYLIIQDNTTSIGQDKSKVQKHLSKLLILIETVTCLK